MADVRGVQMELLLLCRDICTRYGLTYFLFGDALRSAARGGTLQKTDKPALFLPVADLKNFCAYFEREAPKGVVLQNIETEPLCPFVHTKIRKDGTTSLPVALKNMNIHHGMDLDLYPYYPVEVGKLARVRTRLSHKLAAALLAASYVPYQEKPRLLDRLMLKLPEEKRKHCAKKLLKGMEKGGKKSMQAYTPYGGGRFFWREALGEETFFLPLCGESFRVPDRREVFLNMENEKEMPGERIIDAGKGFEKYTKQAKPKAKQKAQNK